MVWRTFGYSRNNIAVKKINVKPVPPVNYGRDTKKQDMKTILKVALAVLIIVFAGFVSCKKNELQNPSAGNFTVKLTDSPGDYAALNVEIKSVEAYLEGKGWVTLNSEARVIDLLALTNGVEVVIATKAGVNIGHYTKIKLTFGDNNSLTINATGNGSAAESTTAVDIASHEIEVTIDENVTINATAEVLLDFDVASSVVSGGGGNEGNVIEADGAVSVVIPHVKVIVDVETGIEGDIDGAISAAIIVTDGQNSFSAYADANGKFLIRGMTGGTYKVVINALHLNGNLLLGATESTEIAIENVMVTKGKITSLGTINAGG